MPKFEIDTDAGTVTVDGVNFIPEAAAPVGDTAELVASDKTAASPAGDAVPADSRGGAAEGGEDAPSAASEAAPEGAPTDGGDGTTEATDATSEAAAPTTGDDAPAAAGGETAPGDSAETQT